MTLRGGWGCGGGGLALSVTMMLIFPKTVWTCPVTLLIELFYVDGRAPPKRSPETAIFTSGERVINIMEDTMLSGVYRR